MRFIMLLQHSAFDESTLLGAFTAQMESSITKKIFFFLFTCPSSILSITGRDQTGYTVHAGFCMFPQSCDLHTETAGSL
jgi:hypothetical protein